MSVYHNSVLLLVSVYVPSYCINAVKLDTSRGWPANLISSSGCSSYLCAVCSTMSVFLVDGSILMFIIF